MSFWTDNPDAAGKLRTLWKKGLSASQIAAELGCTRNTVIGKAHRLRLSKRPSPIKRKPRRTWKDMFPHLSPSKQEKCCAWPEGCKEFATNGSWCEEHYARVIDQRKRKKKSDFGHDEKGRWR